MDSSYNGLSINIWSIMSKPFRTILYGFLTWLVPFLAGFPFIDQQGNYLIDEIFFKTIMIVIGALVGTVLAVFYLRDIKEKYLKEAVLVGLLWLAINWILDLIMVMTGFFPMDVREYFMNIGLRYLSMPIYLTGLGLAMKGRNKEINE